VDPRVSPWLIFRIFVREPAVVTTLLLGCAAGLLVARPLVRRFGGRPLWVGLSVASLGGIAAVTLVPDAPDAVLPGLAFGRAADGVRRCAADAWASVSGFGAGLDGPMNVALYLPAGLFLTCWSRRPLPVAAGLCMLSLVIEVLQVPLGRSCQAVDWVANSLGGVLGAALAAGRLAATTVLSGRTARRTGPGR
jgi:hypothetical protein